MSRPTWTSLALLCCTGLALPAAAAGLDADSAKVYRTTQGVSVELVMLKPPSEISAIIRITGTSGPLDGLALPYKYSISGTHESFTTSWHGRQFSFVQVDRRNRERWELYVPGELNRSRPLSYDENQSKALKANSVLGLYEKQLKDGTLQKFAAFHRAEEQAGQDKTLADSAAAADKECGGHVVARIVWSTVDDETLKKYSVGSYCSEPLSAMASLCKKAPIAATTLREKVKEVSCSWSGPTQLTIAAGKLELHVDGQSSNLEELATKNLEALELSPPAAASSGEQPPWGDGHTLGQRITLARTTLCTDGKNHYVASTAHTPNGPQMYYGDGKKLARVPVADALGSGAFFEPRLFNPTANASFRGADVRLDSFVEIDEAKQTCRVTCGTRKSELKILPASEVAPLLTAASYLPPQDRRTPHSLNRDERGNYYYVDKGATADKAQDFRLFVGPKGNLKLQKMTNVVSDSQGEIFSTKNGALRFLVGPQGRESSWVKGESKTKLLAVPIEENFPLIYNELGVYVGEKRGTPCDDL